MIPVGCILLKKTSMWALPTVPLFAGKSRFFTRNVPLKTFSRLAGLEGGARTIQERGSRDPLAHARIFLSIMSFSKLLQCNDAQPLHVN